MTYSDYRDVSKEAFYPFGYGLSYATFEYGELQLSSEEMEENGAITVTVPVTNKGKMAGKEVVQLYLRDLVASRTRPVKELKGFEMVELQPGETKDVTFNITNKMLEFYNANREWASEEGRFEVFIGGNSRDVKSAEFYLNK